MERQTTINKIKSIFAILFCIFIVSGSVYYLGAPTNKFKVGDCIKGNYYWYKVVEVGTYTYTLENPYVRIMDRQRVIEKMFRKIDCKLTKKKGKRNDSDW